MADARKQRLIMHSGSPQSSIFSRSQSWRSKPVMKCALVLLCLQIDNLAQLCEFTQINLYRFQIGKYHIWIISFLDEKWRPSYLPWIIVATAIPLIALPCKILEYGFTLWVFMPQLTLWINVFFSAAVYLKSIILIKIIFLPHKCPKVLCS